MLVTFVVLDRSTARHVSGLQGWAVVCLISGVIGSAVWIYRGVVDGRGEY